jgi:hypothetical protein
VLTALNDGALPRWIFGGAFLFHGREWTGTFFIFKPVSPEAGATFDLDSRLVAVA